MILKENQFDFDGTTYTAEISELYQSRSSGPRSAPYRFTMSDCVDGIERTFVIERVDKSGGDTAGWWYKEENSLVVPRKVLIIND